MQHSDAVIISLANETTASRFLYEVSPAVSGLIRYLPPERLSAAMPQQSPYGLGYEQVSYAMALVQLAKEFGIEDADISVTPLSVPGAEFESGWEGDGRERGIEATERLFPLFIRLSPEEIRATCRDPKSVSDLSQLLCATAFFRSRDGKSPYVVPYGFGIGTEPGDRGQFFVTVHDAADCGHAPDEDGDTFATYKVYAAPSEPRAITLERIHVGQGLNGAEDCRMRPGSIAWGEAQEEQALVAWQALVKEG